ncbi:MAG: mechanosensitive ion channel family protein [Dehalococcoidia bacterium]
MFDINIVYENILQNQSQLIFISGLFLIFELLVIGLAPLITRSFLNLVNNTFGGTQESLRFLLIRIIRVSGSIFFLILYILVVENIIRTELMTRFISYTEILDSVIHFAFTFVPKILLILLLVVIANKVIAYTIPMVIRFHISAKSDSLLESEREKNVTTLVQVLSKAANLLVLSTAIFIILGELGIDLAPLLLAAGVVGIAVGFGAQNLVRDIFAGIFIILENQYRVGDIVRIADIGGLVEDINLRRTILRDLDYRQHFIPNGEIRTASNYTKDKSRVNFNIGVAYEEDLDSVIETLNEVGSNMHSDAEWGPLIIDPIKAIRVDNFGDSSIDIRVLGETVPMQQWNVAGEYRLRVKRKFDELGISIPFPQRSVHIVKEPVEQGPDSGDPDNL